MSGLVSICIPAWERPDLLEETLKSCLAQTYAPIEILICDDSRTDAVSTFVESVGHAPPIRYLRNPVRLGQAGNINRLFDEAAGERLVLLHHDDTLLPEALEALDRAWRAHEPMTACYGRQLIMTHSGEPVAAQPGAYSAMSDALYDCSGAGRTSLWYALAGYFPPDGFMVSTVAARATRYREYDEVGDACDYDFKVRLAQQPGNFCFVNQDISRYRITDVSISTESECVDHTYFIVKDLQVPPELEPVKQAILRRRHVYTARREILFGQRKAAWHVMRQSAIPASERRSPGYVLNIVLFCLPRSLVRGIYRGQRRMRRRLRRGGLVYRAAASIRTWRARFARAFTQRRATDT